MKRENYLKNIMFDTQIIDDKFINFLVYPQFEGWLLVFKIFLILLSFLLAFSIVILLRKTSWLKHNILEDMSEFMGFRPYGMSGKEKSWNKIVVRLETGLESEYKLAVIEADGMLDDVLKVMGYAGENLGEKLKRLTPTVLSNIAEIKETHQLRDNIVHDPDFKLSLDETRKVLSVYEQALRGLQAL